MTAIHSGRLSDLLLVRVHGRTAAYLAASVANREAIVEACRGEATVPDLAERILARTIYSQASSRVAGAPPPAWSAGAPAPAYAAPR